MTFNSHIATAEQQLIDAVNQLKRAKISELVIDLRYNGGGYLDIAGQLASMVAGDIASGQIFEEMTLFIFEKILISVIGIFIFSYINFGFLVDRNS